MPTKPRAPRMRVLPRRGSVFLVSVPGIGPWRPDPDRTWRHADGFTNNYAVIWEQSARYRISRRMPEPITRVQTCRINGLHIWEQSVWHVPTKLRGRFLPMKVLPRIGFYRNLTVYFSFGPVEPERSLCPENCSTRAVSTDVPSASDGCQSHLPCLLVGLM